MGDVQWERVWPWTRLEMLHSYSQEQVHGLENWPTSPVTPWQSKKVEGPLLKPYQIAELRQGGQQWPCVNLPAQQPFQFDPLRSSPLKDASGDGGSDHQPSPCWPSRGWECNRHQRDQRPQSPGPCVRVTGVQSMASSVCLGLTGDLTSQKR